MCIYIYIYIYTYTYVYTIVDEHTCIMYEYDALYIFNITCIITTNS